MPLMRINYYIYAEKMKKLVQELGRFAFEALAESMYPHLTEDSRKYSSVGSDSALFEIRRTTSHHLE